MGDSITWGAGSTDGNGYRQALADLVKQDSNNLTYIGSIKSGNYVNNENEGHGGFPISSIGQIAKPIYAKKPDIVLLMAGTVDLVSKLDADNAPKRLATVIDDIVTACPDTVVLVATLLPLLDPQISSKTIGFNSALMGIVWKFTSKGKKVDLVDMGRVTPNHISPNDGIHPSDEGYNLIARAWYDGIVNVGRKGWIRQSSPHSFPGLANEVVDQDTHLSAGKEDGNSVEGASAQMLSRLAQLMVQLLVLLGLFFGARKAIIVLIRRYKH